LAKMAECSYADAFENMSLVLRIGRDKFSCKGKILPYENERQLAKAPFQPQQTLRYGSLGSKRD
jgi:hypothetical protein